MKPQIEKGKKNFMKLNENHRIDDLGNGYKIIQDKTKFCFGTDAVVLSNFVNLNNINTVLDIGCGNGIIPVLLCEKKDSLKVTGIDIQEESALLARENAFINNLSDKIDIILEDVKNIPIFFKGKKFDAVVTNPPYVKNLGGIVNSDNSLKIARHEIKCTLEDIIKNAAYVLNSRGKFFMIHRATRITEIIYVLKKYNLEPKILRFVHSNSENNISDANMVLIEAVRGGAEFCTVMPPLIL